MIKITEDTKHVFLAGLLAQVFLVGGVIVTGMIAQAKDEVRLDMIEADKKIMYTLIADNTKGIATDRERTSAILVIMDAISKSQDTTNVLLEGIQGSVTRLETIDEVSQREK